MLMAKLAIGNRKDLKMILTRWYQTTSWSSNKWRRKTNLWGGKRTNPKKCTRNWWKLTIPSKTSLKTLNRFSWTKRIRVWRRKSSQAACSMKIQNLRGSLEKCKNKKYKWGSKKVLKKLTISNTYSMKTNSSKRKFKGFK